MYFRSVKKTAGDLSLSESIDSDPESNSLSLMDVIFVDDDMLDRFKLQGRLRTSSTADGRGADGEGNGNIDPSIRAFRLLSEKPRGRLPLRCGALAEAMSAG
jgi:hypothetical protein